MLAVNLLPWRRLLWQRQRQQSFTLLGCVLTVTLCAALALWWRGVQRQHQQQEIHAVSTQMLDALQQQLNRQRMLLAQRDALQQAVQTRQWRAAQHQRWQQFWQQLPTLMPDTLWLNRVERRQGLFLLEGQAQSVLAVRDFRQQLTAQALFTRVRPGGLQRLSGGSYRFSLQARLQEVTHE